MHLCQTVNESLQPVVIVVATLALERLQLLRPLNYSTCYHAVTKKYVCKYNYV